MGNKFNVPKLTKKELKLLDEFLCSKDDYECNMDENECENICDKILPKNKRGACCKPYYGISYFKDIILTIFEDPKNNYETKYKFSEESE
jgi:hypothetical protein